MIWPHVKFLKDPISPFCIFFLLQLDRNKSKRKLFLFPRSLKTLPFYFHYNFFLEFDLKNLFRVFRTWCIIILFFTLEFSS
ncbi:hypothetical protein EYC84_005589 [Monilinia fructicola]|uniref:Uncharacterized protein n=1 Tax=Monilinia fructicola TaxID=38448 RepID=A0A5M9JZH6_MONFR|nr:hypothetical protein EYC84_005589 [Monilinia fructicola]